MFARLRSWVRATRLKRNLDREIQDEMQLHIDLYSADLVRRGVSADEAHRLARVAFGSVDARRDECREVLGLRIADELRGDVRYAFRLLRRSPAFTIVAVLSLALGIGANTAIFSLVDTVLLKSMPVVQPERLFFVDNSGGKSHGSNAPPYPCFEIFRDRSAYFSSMAAFEANRFKVTIDGIQEQIRGQFASASYFAVLGVPAAYGRVLRPEDDSLDSRGGPDGPVAVISHALWKRRFGMSPDVLGKTIQVGTNTGHHRRRHAARLQRPHDRRTGRYHSADRPLRRESPRNPVVVVQRRRAPEGWRVGRAGARGPRRDVPGLQGRQSHHATITSIESRSCLPRRGWMK